MALVNGGEAVGSSSGMKFFMMLGTVLSTFDRELGSKVRSFFTQIEEVAELHGCNAAEHLRVAKIKLSRIARDFAYNNMKMKNITNYKDFKQAMIARFGMELPSIKIQNFIGLCKKKAKTFKHMPSACRV